ncbi:MAG: glycosyltransferase family 2 protein [Candidatus Omnitrophica bacterium]|nr:glycosyltransferase family 2 protein [Candidatus Omnitrophota bacterium]
MSDISVVIVTENAQDTIKDCLDSASWADEIVVADAESSDQTIEIVTKYTDRIVKIDPQLNSGQRWNQAIAAASKNWIFLLESDKRIPLALRLELEKRVKENKLKDADGYLINTRNYFLNHWVKTAGFYPDRKLYIFRKGMAKFQERQRGCIVFEGKIDNLNGYIEHYVYRSLEQCFSKVNKESDNLAEEFFGQGLIFKKRFVITKPLRTFKKQYFRHRGSKQGMAGLLISLVAAFECFFVYIKVWAIRR